MEAQQQNSPYVIVGGGLAGVSAAEALRTAGYEGEIVLLSQESELPYDRPPLSKEVLRAEELPRNLPLRSADFYAQHKIDVRLNARVAHIDTTGKTLKLADGSAIVYAKLLLATGSRTRVLPTLPLGTPHVHYLRNLDEALALRKDMLRVKDKGRMLVIGAGIIGLEVAAVATEFGLKVTVVEAGPRPLGRSASEFLSAFLAQAHLDHGVDIQCGVQVASMQDNGQGFAVKLSNGQQFDADLVVVGIGVVPNVELAKESGIEAAPEGIIVDGRGQTSAVDVYAAGEVAFHYNARESIHRREETWQHAADHGAHVGQAMTGGQELYAGILAYWTDQYDYSIQVFGNPVSARDVVRGDPSAGTFTIFHMDGPAISGVTAVNSARELRKIKPLVLAHAIVPDDVIRNSDIDPSKHVLQSAAA